LGDLSGSANFKTANPVIRSYFVFFSFYYFWYFGS